MPRNIRSKAKKSTQSEEELRVLRPDSVVAGCLRSYSGDYGPNGDRLVSITYCPNKFSNVVLLEEVCIGFCLEYFLLRPLEKQLKDGPALIYTEQDGGRCDVHAKKVCAATFEIDGKLTLEETVRRVKASGYEAVVYTTHNHLRTRQSVRCTSYQSWHARHHPELPDPTDETIRAYCAQDKRLDHLRNVRLADSGRVYEAKEFGRRVRVFDIAHDPEHKLRIVFFLDRPVVLQGENCFPIAAWHHNYQRHGNRILGDGVYSAESKNPARLHYLPSHMPGVAYAAVHCTGVLLDILQDWEAAPARSATTHSTRLLKNAGTRLSEVRALLGRIAPDLEYPDWYKCGAAIHHETGGSEDGWALFHEWSEGDSRYDFDQTEALWDSFDPAHPNPATIGTLLGLANTFNQNSAAQTAEEKRRRRAAVEAQYSQMVIRKG